MKIKKIVTAALFAALVCVATMIIKIPSPLKGYLNLGDGIVLLAGWILPGGYGFFAAGIGSALADIFSGYVSYAPATFIIKGCMALVAMSVFGFMSRLTNKQLLSRIVSSVSAEILMIGGYYIFEGFLYGFAPSAVNIIANGIQGTAGLILGVALIKLLHAGKLLSKYL